jgi:hypothetical protein
MNKTDSESKKGDEIHEKGLYDSKKLKNTDAFYPNIFLVCGESASNITLK